MFGTRSYSDFGNCILGALLILVVLSTCCLSSSTITMDSMLPNQTISDGQTLVSANETFTLGFFSPGASTYRYVGIWYGDVPNRTVVWVANRNNPILDASGVLMFDSIGNLVILDGRGSSFTVAYGSGAKDTEATILDTGNLVLRKVSNWSTVIWQSFDSPTDTWLPGMKLGLVGRQNHLLTSWKSSDDPAIGDYSFGMDPNREKTRFFIWERGHVSWSSRLWDGSGDAYDFIISPNVNATFVSNDDEQYLSYSAKPGSIIRYVLDFSGQLKILAWIDYGVHEWILFDSWPGGICKIFSPCGAFGICDKNEKNHCKCPKGFAPGDGIGWSTGDTRRGCIRQISLACAGDKFLQMPNMGLPGNASTLPITGQKQCESTCLTNCSCTAYALAQDGCSLWYGNLMQLREGQSGDAVGTLYLRLAASELESRGAPVILIASIVSSITFLIFVALLFLLWIRRQKNEGQGKLHDHCSLLTLDTDGASKLWESKETGRQFTLFRFSEIASATGNFSPENKLGEGGFGPVYKGNLPEGQEIAIKRLAAHSGQGLLEFKNEILLIAKLQHRNLVRLLGCCIHGDEKILIYEYMPNKSLDFFLFEQSRSTMLDWATRIYIIEGIAQGLLYLHKHSRLRIIHRDLKASNILLDIDMNPKISDFGMARIFCSEETQANTNRVVGTYGYMAPEYAMEGIFSVKSDVFSFGVLLLEIVSGIRNAGFHQRGSSISLIGFAWQLWKEGRWSELVDPAPGDTCAGHKVVRCIHVSLMCVQENAVDRPTMTEVISMLTNESTTLPDPKQPAFLSIGAPADTDVNGGTCSLNVVTITDPHGR